MIRNGLRALFALTLAVCLAGPSRLARAQTPADHADPSQGASKPAGERVPWQGSMFIWDHSVTTQTIGIGRDYQSRNPTYEMMFRLAPRYYLLDDVTRSLSARADIRVVREFTNSDVTTERGEWTFVDTEVWLAYVHALGTHPGTKSDLMLRFPSLLLPTSKTSWLSGRRIGLAGGVGLDQEVPLRGAGAVLSSVLLRPRATYTYQFVESKVVARSGFDRIRLDPEGRSLPSDQLSGSAQPQHLLNLSLRIDTTVLENLRVITELGLRYARRYALPGSVAIENVDTGPVMPENPPSPARWDVTTLFSTGVYYAITPYADVGIGYENLSSQLGAEGRRRGFFYSPDARAFLSFVVMLGELYHDARGEALPEPYHTAGSSQRSRF